MAAIKDDDSERGAGGYAMKAVARMTGLTPHVIRVWERRYEAVSPARSAVNRRLYTDADVKRLRLLRRATQNGHGIGRIAGLSEEQLQRLAAPIESPSDAAEASKGSDDPQDHFEDALGAARDMDPTALESALHRAAVSLTRPRLIDGVIVPLMTRIGELWSDGSLRVSHEHLTSAIVRTFLASMNEAYDRPASAPGLIVTTPSGQMHELGALMAATVAAWEGWRVIYLGPNLPTEEIAWAARQYRARAVALSIMYPYPTGAPGMDMETELGDLRRSLDDETALLVGGRASHAYGELLDRIGAFRLDDFAALRQRLAVLSTD